jgi:hypothetical protein
MKSPLESGFTSARLIRVAIALISFSSATVFALAPPSEYQLKAVFLFNFAQFVEWPQTAFEGPDDSLSICLVGQDPFGDELDAVMQGEEIGGRAISIHRYPDAASIEDCHLLYVRQPEHELRETLQKVEGAPVLTVGETEAFTAFGGMIRFQMEGNKVRLLVNPKPADEARLRLSSKLLRSSRIVAQNVTQERRDD